jgi:ribosome-associated protein
MAAKKKTLKKKPAAKKTPAKRPAAKAASSAKKKSPARSAPKKKAAAAVSKKRVVRKTKRPALRAKAKPTKPKKVEIKPALPPNDEALALARLISAAVGEKKALDVMILDVRRKGAAVGYDYVVLATAESDRQLEALADAARDAVKATGRNASGVEASPDWVAVDFDDVVVHFFTPDKRETYDFEGMWSDAPRVEVAP